MQIKESYSQVTKREIALHTKPEVDIRQDTIIDSADNNACPHIHGWEFKYEKEVSLEEDTRLRDAFRHMISYRHKIDDSEYGGYQINESLSEQLSISALKKLGFLDVVVLRFGGDVSKAIKFAFPEGLSTHLPIDFEDEEDVKPISTKDIKQLLEMEDDSAKDILQTYLNQAWEYPIFNRDNPEQERIALRYLSEKKSIDDLRKDSDFWTLVKPDAIRQFRNVFADSQDIRTLIINCNLPLVISRAKKFQGRGLPLVDLIQEGSFGLIRAIEDFDHTKGNKFGTYATWWIDERLHRAIENQSRTIRLPSHMHSKIGKVFNLVSKFVVENGYEPNREEMQELLVNDAGLSQASARSVIQNLQSGVTRIDSLDREVGMSEAGERSLTDFTPDKTDTAEEAIKNVSDEALRADVERALIERLDGREREVVRLSLVDDESLERIGELLGFTKEQVRRLQKKSLQKLKEDQRLQAWWEIDMPHFVYTSSAEEAAFRLGLFGKENYINFKIERQRVDPYEEVVFDSSTQKNRKDKSESDCQLISLALDEKEVWDQFTEHEKGMLKLYSRGSSDMEVTRVRLALIFGTSALEVDKVLDSCLRRLRQSRQIFDKQVESFIKEDPKIPSKEIADILSKKIGSSVSVTRVQSARRRLIDNRRIIKRQELFTPEKLESLDTQVENLIKQNPNIHNRQIAVDLNQPLGSITSSITRLRKAKRIGDRSPHPNKGTRAALEQYLVDHANEDINLSEFARQTGVSRERARQLWNKITEE